MLLQEYYTYLNSTHRHRTVEMYKWHLNHFNAYLHNHIENTTPKDISGYISTRKWNTAVRAQFINVVKTFFRWYLPKIPVGTTDTELRYALTMQNVIKEILAYPIPTQEHHIENKSLNIQEVWKLLSYTKRSSEVDYDILWILLYFGFRKHELLSLNPQKHIDWKNNSITITVDISKTSRERILYFDTYTRARLIGLLKAIGSKSLLCNVDETYLNKTLQRYDKVIGRHIFPHMCRHTYISLMMRSIKGKSALPELYIIKTLAGHSSSDMTLHYTDMGDECKTAMLQHHYMIPFERE